MADLRTSRLRVDAGSLPEDLARIQGLFGAVSGSIDTTTKRLTGTSREFQALARQAGVVTDAGAKIIRVFGEAQAAIDKGSVSADGGARALAQLAQNVGVTAQGLVQFVTEAKASQASLEKLTAGTKEHKEALNAHKQGLVDLLDKQQAAARAEKDAAEATRQAAEREVAAVEVKLKAARAVQALAEEMDSSVAAQSRFAAKQQDVVDLFMAGELNGRQFAKAMEFVTSTFDPAAVAARKLTADYQDLLAKYDPVRAAVREHGQELARVTAILDKANATEEVRATVMKAVAEAYDPATKAANERTAALKREREEQAELLAGYREQAALARTSADGQGRWSAYAGVTTMPSKSAKESADAFGPLLQNQEVSDKWEALIAEEGFREKERIAQTKTQTATNWEAQIAMDAWGAQEAKAQLAAEWEGILAVEGMQAKERVALTKAAVAENWEAQIAMDGFAAAEAKAKLAQEWEGLLATEEFAQKERLAQLERHAAQVMQAEMDMASFDAPAKFNRLVASYDKDSADALRYANALSELRATAAAAGVPLDQLAAAEEKLAQSMSPGAAAAKKQVDWIDNLRGRVDPASKALKQLADDQKRLDDLFTRGKLDGGKAEYDELTAAIERHRVIVERSTASQRSMTNALGLTRGQMTALAPQINDVVSGLAMGQAPMQILVQQGGQIVQALQAGGAEFKLFSGSMGLALGVAAGLGVALVSLVAASESYRNSINAVADANRVMGDATGYSRGQLEALAGSLDYVSTRSARELEVAFIRVGNVSGAQFKGALEITRDFARATGQELPEAAKTLADILKDPAKGAEALRDSYRALTAAQAEYVQRLAAQGEVGKAQQIQIDALKAKYQNFADEGVGYLARAYHVLRTGVSDAWDWMGQIGAPKSLTMQLADAEAVVAKIEAKFRSTMKRAPVGDELRQTEPEAYDQVETLRARKAAEDAVVAARAAVAAAEERRKAGLSMSKQIDTEIGQQNALNDQYRTLETSAAAYVQQIEALAQGEGRAGAQLGQVRDAYGQVAEALDRVKNAKATYLTTTDRIVKADQIALNYASQYGQMADRNRARDQAVLDTAGQKLTTEERRAKINSAVNQVIAQQTVAVTGQVAAAQSATTSLDGLTVAYGQNAEAVRNAELAQKIAQATLGMAPGLAQKVAQATINQELAQRRLNAATFAANLRDQVEDTGRQAEAWKESAAAAHEAALANETLTEARKRGLNVERDAATIRGIAAGVLARDMAQRAQTFGQMAEEQRQAVALANAEFAMLGQSNAARAQQVAMLQTANDLRAKGADLTDAGTKAYIAQAGELARVNSLLQDAAQNAANVAQPIATAFEDVLVGTKKTGDAIKAIGEDLNRIFVRMTFTKPFETLVTGELTKIMAGPVTVANDNTPKAAAGSSVLDRIIGQVNSGLGTSPDNALWVRAASASAVDLGTAGLRFSDLPLPVAVKDAGELEGIVEEFSAKYGMDANLVKAVIQRESGWNPAALNTRSGAAGLMQIMPANWSAYGVTNPFDARQNVDAGIRMLKEHIDRAGGDVEKGLASFGGFVTKSADGYIGAVNASKAAYEQAGSKALALADSQAAVADSSQRLKAEQQKLIVSALGVQRANIAVEDKQASYAAGYDLLIENMQAEAQARQKFTASQTESAHLVAQASQQSAFAMVSGTQQALGGLMGLFGGATGSGGLSMGGAVLSAGGPQGIQSALDRLWSNIPSSGSSNGTIGGWLSTPIFANNASKAVTTNSYQGIDDGTAGFDTTGAFDKNGQAVGGASSGVTWGQGIGGALSIAGGAMQLAKGGTGNMISGGANMVAGAMAFTPLAWAAPLVSIAGSLIGGLIDNDKPDPYSITRLTTNNGKFKRGLSESDNGGDASKYNAAVDQVASKLNSLIDKYGLTAPAQTLAVADKGMTPEQAMIAALKSMKTENSDIAWVLAHDVKDDLDEAVNSIDFAAKFQDTVSLWNAGMSSVVASFQQGRAAANDFGKSITAFLDQAAITYDVSALSKKTTGNPAVDKMLASMPGYATGTPSARAGWAVVGEEGPEIVRLAGGERIWNAKESAQILAGMGQGRDDTLIHLRSGDELAAVRRALGTQGAINPATGLLAFESGGDNGGAGGGHGSAGDASSGGTGNGGVGGGSASGRGGENAAHGEVSASTSARDAAYGGGWGTGGVGGAIDSLTTTIDRALASLTTSVTSVNATVANALGMNAKETAALSGMVGITGVVGVAGIRGLAEALGGMLGATVGVGSAGAVSGPGDPAGSGAADLSWVRQVESAIAKATVDGIKEARTSGTYDQMVAGLGGQMVTTTAGVYMDEAAGTYSDPAAALGRVSTDELGRMDEALTNLTKAFTDAGEQVPAVLGKALANIEGYAAAHGVLTVSAKTAAAAAQDQQVTDALSAKGISSGRFAEINGVVSDLAANTFTPVGKDFAKLAADMTTAMQAMTAAGKAVPETFYAAQKRMEALAAAKARIDAQIAGVPDLSTDYQKAVAQATGYWSRESTDLVKAMQAVGYEGDELTKKLGEGLKNAIANVNKETAKAYTNDLNAAQGKDYLNQIASIREWHTKNGMDVNKATGDDTAANRMYGTRMDAVMKGLSIDQLSDVIKSSTDDVAVGFAQSWLVKALEKFSDDNGLRILKDNADLAAAKNPNSADATAAQNAYEMRALEIQQQRELADVTDEAVKAQIRNAQSLERKILLEKQDAAQREKLLSTGGSVRDYLDKQRATAGVGVSPEAARNAAQDQFARDLALARGGDTGALGRISATADRLIAAQQGVTASGTETQAMRSWVLSSLESLPATKTYDEQMLEELKKLGGSVNVTVELATVRAISESLNALSDTDRGKLTQSQVVLRTVEEKLGRLLTDAELGQLVTSAAITRDITQSLGRDLTAAERSGLVSGGEVLRSVSQSIGRALTSDEAASLITGGAVSRNIEQSLGRKLTDAEASSLVTGGAVLRSVEQSIGRVLTDYERSSLVTGGAVGLSVEQFIGRSLTDAERASLVSAGGVDRVVEQSLGRTLTSDEMATLVSGGNVLRTVEQSMGRTLTAAEMASLVSSEAVTRTIGQSIGRNLSATEVASLVVGATVERTVEQALGRTLTADERAGLVTAATVTRSVEQSIGRSLTAAEQAAIILPGSVTRTIGQTVAAATGAPLIVDGPVTRKVSQDVTETVTTSVMRDLTTGFAAVQLQAASIVINKLDAVGRLILDAGLNTVRAITGNWSWGSEIKPSAAPTVLTTADATYLARYADIADWWAADPSRDPAKHYAQYGAAEGRTFQVGGVVGAFATGGVVGNGLWNVDSVLARYAGGGDVALAGGEGILTAPATAAIGGKSAIDWINTHHQLPSLDIAGGYERGGVLPGPANDYVPTIPRPTGRTPAAPSKEGDNAALLTELRETRKQNERLINTLIRVTAASGDANVDGLAEVADRVTTIARKVASGGIRE